jgi:hypothetical protein
MWVFMKLITKKSNLETAQMKDLNCQGPSSTNHKIRELRYKINLMCQMQHQLWVIRCQLLLVPLLRYKRNRWCRMGYRTFLL